MVGVDPGVLSATDFINGTDIAGAGVDCQRSNDTWRELGCISTYRVDSYIFVTMLTSGLGGLLCLGAFCFLQPFICIYRARLVRCGVMHAPGWCGSSAVTRTDDASVL